MICCSLVLAAVVHCSQFCLWFSETYVPVRGVCLAIIDEDILRYERVQKKAYVRLVTTLGNLNLELHADMVICSSVLFQFLCLWMHSAHFLEVCCNAVGWLSLQ